MEVILLQNTLMSGKRFDAGSKVVVDAELGKRLIEHCLASEVPMIEAEPVAIEAVKPVAKPKTRRTVRKKVTQ